MKITVTQETVAYLEQLARLRLPERERETMQAELQGILDYMAMLEELPEQGGEPHTPKQGALRADEVKPSFEREELMQNGKRVKDGAYLVPQTVE